MRMRKRTRARMARKKMTSPAQSQAVVRTRPESLKTSRAPADSSSWNGTTPPSPTETHTQHPKRTRIHTQTLSHGHTPLSIGTPTFPFLPLPTEPCVPQRNAELNEILTQCMYNIDANISGVCRDRCCSFYSTGPGFPTDILSWWYSV